MTERIRIAVVALDMVKYAELAAFGRHMEDIAEAAKAGDADVLLLPEFTCLGLLWTDEAAGRTDVGAVADLYERVLTPLAADYRQILSDIATKAGLMIAGASLWHRETGRGCNSAYVFGPDGSVLRQDKLHPTRPERAIGTIGGEALAVLEFADVRMGIAVCYDIQFPEVCRHLAEAGAEVILVPSFTDQRGYWRVRHCAHARAVENQCFVCVSPLLGSLAIPCDRPLYGHGAAYVACPIDDRFAVADGTLAQIAYDRPGLLFAELDLELLRLSRERAEIRPLADRRGDLYRSLAVRLERV
ncbi:MAG TPA: nitrilase-related carbon-nitrogen hydrolase [Aestuariivirgaceae bacterium]|nr:nitrilase-related carbon-nitrogen hydrolase [Aestuariivirgaceae bacterium]